MPLSKLLVPLFALLGLMGAAVAGERDGAEARTGSIVRHLAVEAHSGVSHSLPQQARALVVHLFCDADGDGDPDDDDEAAKSRRAGSANGPCGGGARIRAHLQAVRQGGAHPATGPPGA